jgi:hypothetical protein
LRKFYQGPINLRTGERIYAGNPQGSENNSGFPAAFATLGQQAALKWGLGNDFDFSTFDFDLNMDMVDEHMDIPGEPLAAILNANTADLGEFKSRDGKLILAHGFADPRSPPLNTVAYYERLIASQTPGNGHGQGERERKLCATHGNSPGCSCFREWGTAMAVQGPTAPKATRCLPHFRRSIE